VFELFSILKEKKQENNYIKWRAAANVGYATRIDDTA